MKNNLRKDLYKIDIEDNVYFLVFHKSLSFGFGPSLSLYINNKEILKFDCFGDKKGHYHINNSERIFFIENTCLEQINKIIYELSNNLNYYLNQINNKNFNLNINIFMEKLLEAKNKMIEYENKYYSMKR